MDLTAVARVSAVYPETYTVKVIREDKGIVSKDLQVLKRGDNWLPEVGQYVVCLFLPRSSSAGYVLGEI